MTIRPVFAALLLATALMPVPATAQPVSDQAISDFVDSHSAVTRQNKIARWEDGICPQVTGLPANFIKFITKRIRDLGASVGAPVDPDENCKSNIEIVFTLTPQELLNSIREKQPIMLGYYDSSAQAEEIAKVTHVIQSWHATQTVDLRGNKVIDSRNPIRPGGRELNAVSATGLRTGDGVHSSYYRGVVVADPGKLVEYEIGTLADHIAMLALAQPAKPSACTELPSILDTTNSACRKDAPVKAVTKADTGYLVGLYKMDSGASLRGQKDAIAHRIREALAGP
jgi:hypothetical protein